MIPGIELKYYVVLSREDFLEMKKEKKEQRERARFNEKCKEIENKLSMFERLELNILKSSNPNSEDLKQVIKNKKEYLNKKKLVTTLKTIDEEKKIEIQLLKKSKKSITNKTLKAIEEGKKAEDILQEREKMVASKKLKKENIEKTIEQLSDQLKEYVAKLKDAGYKLTNSRLNDIQNNKDVLKIIQDEEKQMNDIISKLTDSQKVKFSALKASGKKITIKKLSKL